MTVEARTMKAVAFSPVVIVVSMCECNWACRRLVKDSMMLSEYEGRSRPHGSLGLWSREHGPLLSKRQGAFLNDRPLNKRLKKEVS